MSSFYTPSVEKTKQLEELIVYLKNRFIDSIIDVSFLNHEVSIIIKKESILNVFQELRDNSRYAFNQLIDIVIVDYPEKEERFEIIYLLLSLSNNLRLKVKINVSEGYIVDSLSNIYSNSDWLEREAYDMFGVYFKGHKDLRRILTDFGFEGNPLRKDFPLTGFVEVEFNEEYQKVMYKPVELIQDYRNYSYNNPWMDKIEVDMFDYLNKKDKNN